MVYVNLKVFDNREKKYVQVKAKKGGGCCKIKFRLDLDFEEVQNTCINYFWERRKNICRRTKSSYDFSLVVWREELQDAIKIDGESQPFNIEKFLKANKQTCLKLTLLTKLKKSQSPEKLKQNKRIELFVDDDDEEENGDFLFYDLHERPPEFLEPQLEKVAINSIFSSTDKNTESSLLNVNHHVNNANNDILKTSFQVWYQTALLVIQILKKKIVLTTQEQRMLRSLMEIQQIEFLIYQN